MTRQSAQGPAVRTRALALVAIAFGMFLNAVPANAQQTVRVGHFPNVTHVQALVARQMERQGKSWFGDRLGKDVKIEWYAYNAGPSAMEAFFVNAIDLAYVGPNPALNAFVRSRGAEVR